MGKCFQLQHRGCWFTSLWSCHLTRDVGHITVSASPARWTDTPSLGQSLDACAFVLTGRLAAQVHKWLQREKKPTWNVANAVRNTTQRTSSTRKERDLCNTGFPVALERVGQYFPSLSQVRYWQSHMPRKVQVYRGVTPEGSIISKFSHLTIKVDLWLA